MIIQLKVKINKAALYGITSVFLLFFM